MHGAVDVSVGRRRIGRLSWPPAGSSCPVRLSVADGELTIAGRTFRLSSPHPDGMPSVSALVSQIDLSAERNLRVRVETRTYETTPSTRQLLAIGTSVIFMVLALLVAMPVTRRRGPLHGIVSTQRLLRSVSAPDVVVVAFLVAWTIVGPATIDDGWVWMRQRIYSDLGTFSHYAEAYGAFPPLYYWLEWLQHWVTATADDIVIHRLPILGVLVAGWIVARWSCRKALGENTSPVVLWVLASTFVLMCAAWGMTLRPEPFECLLVGVSVACALWFVAAPGLVPLAVATLAVALAVTAHPQGVTALAPIVASAPAIVRWLRAERGNLVRASSVATSGLALVLVLVFLDSDLETWTANWRLNNAYYKTESPWWFEPARYRDLVRYEWWATPLRVASVGGLLLIVAAYLANRRRVAGSALSSLPPASLALALVLLTADPTKSPYHFGSLGILASVAAATVCARSLEAPSRVRAVTGPILLLLLITLVCTASLRANGYSNALDITTRTWLQPTIFGVDVFSPYPWLLAGTLACASILILQRRNRRSGAPRHITAWSVPVVAFGIVALTAAVLTADALEAEWALPRQNLSALAGRDDCGLAESVQIRSRDGSGTTSLASVLRQKGVLALLEPAPAPYFPCASTPAYTYGLVEVPDLVVGWQLQPWPLVVPASPFASVGDLYSAAPIYYDDAEVTVHEIRRDVAGMKLLPAERVSGP